MVHVYFKYLFFLCSIAVNNINVTPYPELANKIAFLRIFYITTYKKPEILRFSRKHIKIYDIKKIAKQKNFLKQKPWFGPKFLILQSYPARVLGMSRSQ